MNLQKRHLHQKITEKFTKDELRAVCLGLGINFEELDDKTIGTLAESLLLYVEKRGRITDLIQLLEAERPNVDWTELALEEIECPYRGLLPFREEDSHLFFGRDAYIDRLKKAVNKQSLVAVIGPSGSGKSSVVFAGLLPRLRQTGKWQAVTFSPGNAPFSSLAGTLMPLLEPQLSKTDQLRESNKLSVDLKENNTPLSQVFSLLKDNMSVGQQFILIIDQFEELFTQSKDAETQERFMQSLLSLDAIHNLTVLLTMRADFLGRALLYRPFADKLQEASQMIGPMDRQELIDVIERPLAGTFVAFQSGLTTQILNDVGQEPGNLPLLEFALTSLWDEQVDGELTFSSYEKMGKVEGALASHAENTFEALDTEAKEERVQRLFMQLVQPVTGTLNTKRKARRSELGSDLWPLTFPLANARLIVTGQDKSGEETVELAHEALITNWERLRGWIQEDWEFRAWQERLRGDLHRWENRDNDTGFLLLEAPLTVAEEWLKIRQIDLSPQETSFIETSIEAESQRLAKEEVRRQRELETAQTLAETEKERAEEQAMAAAKLRNRAFFLVGALGIAILLAIVAFLSFQDAQQSENNALVSEATAVAAFGTSKANSLALEVANTTSDARVVALQTSESQTLADSTRIAEAVIEAQESEAIALTAQTKAVSAQELAEQEALISRSRELAAIALNQINEDAERGLLIAIEAFNVAPTIQAEAALRQLLFLSKIRIRFQTNGNYYYNNFTWSNDGTHIAITFAKDTITILDIMNLDPIQELQTNNINIDSLSWSPNGSYLASSLTNGTILIWDVTRGNIIDTLTGNYEFIESFSWSPNSQNLVVSGCNLGQRPINCEESEVFVWFPFENKPYKFIERITCNNVQINCGIEEIEWSPEGNFIAAGVSDGSVMIWDTDFFTNIAKLNLDKYPIYDIDWSPDGKSLATISYHLVRVLSFPELEISLTAMANSNNSLSNEAANVDWSSDSERLAFNGQDYKIRVLEIESGEISLLTGHTDDIMDLHWSPQGTFVASSSRDGDIILWDTSLGESTTFLSRGLGYFVNSVVWHPNNIQLAFNYYGLETWNNDLKQWIRVPGFRPRNAVAWNPSGTLLAFDSEQNTTKIIDAETFEESIILDGHSEPVKSISWNSDGTLISTASEDNTVRIWEVETGREITRINPPDAVSTDSSPVVVDWSPDDRFIAFSLQSNIMWVWDLHLSTGNPITVTDRSKIRDLEWSPNGSMIATASGEGQVWDAISGKNLFSLNIGANNSLEGVYSLAWSPDSNLLATGKHDGTIRIWDIETQQNIKTFSEHWGRINSLDWSSDGRFLASGSNDFTSRIYYMDVNELVNIAKDQISWQILHENEPTQRELTLVERQQFLNESMWGNTPTP